MKEINFTVKISASALTNKYRFTATNESTRFNIGSATCYASAQTALRGAWRWMEKNAAISGHSIGEIDVTLYRYGRIFHEKKLDKSNRAEVFNGKK